MKAKHTCEYNIDTGCVEIRVPDKGLAVERSVADNRFDRSELDRLIYNDPSAYTE